MENENYTVLNNEEKLQFEVSLKGNLATLTYQFYKKDIALMHTEVPAALGGRGIATALAKAAFQYADQKKKLVMVYCPFVARFIKKNTEYRKQLDPQYLYNSEQ